MNIKYPIINENYHLHITATECTLFYIEKGTGDKENLGLKNFLKWRIHPLMAQYLISCDGKTTHNHIASTLDVPFTILIDQGASYLESETGVIRFSEDTEDCSNKLFLTGYFNTYSPLHVSIEITDYCNFRCKHCYVSSCPENLSKISYEDIITLMDTLYNNGVKVIELTGGECTTHPQFREILKHASDKFNLVSIISNGYVIGANEELANYIGGFDNVIVQISIDGLEEYHDEFRGKKGAFNNAVKAVKYLRNNDIIVRVASSISEDNLDCIEDLFYLCKEIDASIFAVSPVSLVGRGSCFSCSDKNNDLKARIDEKLYQYKDDELFSSNVFALENMIKNKEINCGAGWRTFAINGASGDVRICLLLSDSGIVGNINTDEYGKIFSREKLDIFRHTPSPSPFLDTCRDCEYNQRCNSCIAKALDVYENIYRECPWAKKFNISL